MPDDDDDYGWYDQTAYGEAPYLKPPEEEDTPQEEKTGWKKTCYICDRPPRPKDKIHIFEKYELLICSGCDWILDDK